MGVWRPRTRDYEEALRELDQLHADGKIDRASYEVHRAKLLAELGDPNSRNIRAIRVILTIPVVLILAFIVLRILAAISNSIAGM